MLNVIEKNREIKRVKNRFLPIPRGFVLDTDVGRYLLTYVLYNNTEVNYIILAILHQ